MSEREGNVPERLIGQRKLDCRAAMSTPHILPGHSTRPKQPDSLGARPGAHASPYDKPTDGTPTMTSRCNSSSSKGSIDISQVAGAAVLARRTVQRSPISRQSSQSPGFKLGRSTPNSMLSDLDAEVQKSENMSYLGLLSQTDANVLREVGKLPIESRLWDADEACPEKSAADILFKLPDFSRYDLHILRLFCHAGQWKQYKKAQVISTQGQEQEEFFIVISGLVGGRLSGKSSTKSSVMSEKDSETSASRAPPRRAVSRTLSGNTDLYGEEIVRFQSGESVGMTALLVTWGVWPMTYLAQTKVEVLSVPRWSLEMMDRPLRWSFDTRTLINVLKQYSKFSREHRAPKKGEAGQLQSADDVAARPSDWLVRISKAMARVPYFGQLAPEVVYDLSRSAVLVELESRQVVWEQSIGLGQERQPGSEVSDNAHENQAGKLHVVLQGKVWVFQKEAHSVSSSWSTARGAGLQDIWSIPARMFEAYGHCVRTLLEGDGMGEATPGLAHECTMIAEPGTVLVRIDHIQHAREVRNCNIVSEQGTVRHLLAMSDFERTRVDRAHLIKILARDVSFFRHISRSHVSKLLEHAVFHKVQKGDLLLKQGQPAEHLCIILSGRVTSYHTKGIAAGDNLCKVWNRWEAYRTNGDYGELGSVVEHCEFGRCVGETDVVEKTPFRTSVVADDEMEVIRICADDYTTVMWDLCDGEALDVDKIRNLLTPPPTERTEDSMDDLIDMLDDSDFLSQFPTDLRRQMTEGMTLIDYDEGHLICEQHSSGTELFLIVSGSVALHSSHDSAGPVDRRSHHPQTASTRARKIGPCMRVLGIGDSFGELAFVQGRRHPTSAITRCRSTVIVIRRADMKAKAVDRMVSFVANPRSHAMDEVFAKEVDDRNEKDILLLINYLETNPLLTQLSYQTMLDCAQSILRHDVPAAQHLRPGLDDVQSDRISESRVYLVNSGSIQVTPNLQGSKIAVKLHEVSEPQPSFGEQLQQQRRGGQSRTATLLFSAFLSLSKVETKEKQDKSGDDLDLSSSSRPQQHVFAIDLSGSITFTGLSAKLTSALSELGHVSEIASLKRTSIPGKRFAVQLGIRGENWILSSNIRSEVDSFVNVLCELNPYFAMKFRSPIWVQEHIQLKRGEAEWKNITLRINNNGELLYSSSLDVNDSTTWLSIGTLHQCINCTAFPTTAKPWALKLVLQSQQKEEYQTSWTFNTGTEAEQHRWLDQFCMKVQPAVLNARFSEDEVFQNEHNDRSSEIISKTVGALMAKTIAHRRRRQNEAKQRVELASVGGASNSSKAPRKHAKTESNVGYSDGSVFVGYGSAFCANGTAIANDAGCVLFSLAQSTWDRIKRTQIELECQEAVKMLRDVPSLFHAAQKDILQLALHSYVSNWPAGEVTPCGLLSSKHVHIILDGVCKLRRVQEKQRHIDKVRTQVLASANGPSSGVAKVDCPKCHGDGFVGRAVPKMSERINLCKTCKGQGSVVEKADSYQTQVAELRASTVLSHCIARSDSLHDYEMIASSSCRLLSVKAELWTDLKLKWERLGPPVPTSLTNCHADLTEQLLDNARAIRLAVKEGPVEQVLPKQLRFVKSLSLEEKAQRSIEKVHSARMREIDRLLSTQRERQGEVYVDTKSEARSSVCSLAPPKTIVNRFAGLVPPLNLDPVVGDDVRGVFLTHMPATERPSAPAAERLLASTVRNSKLLRVIQPGDSFISTSGRVLAPLSGRDAIVPSHTIAALATTRSAIETLAHPWHSTEYAPRVTLKYGNSFSLDHRQKRIYKSVKELLSQANYADFSSHASIAKQGSQGMDPNAATVDMFEFFGALDKYRLLEDKMSHERVQSLKAVSKKDATSIFKKCGQTDEGKSVSRLTQAMFHEAVKLVAGLLQTPLNGQPSGKPMRQRSTGATKDPRLIQQANTMTLTQDDLFASPVRAKHDLQARFVDIENAAAVGLASISRNPATLPAY